MILSDLTLFVNTITGKSAVSLLPIATLLTTPNTSMCDSIDIFSRREPAYVVETDPVSGSKLAIFDLDSLIALSNKMSYENVILNEQDQGLYDIFVQYENGLALTDFNTFIASELDSWLYNDIRNITNSVINETIGVTHPWLKTMPQCTV